MKKSSNQPSFSSSFLGRMLACLALLTSCGLVVSVWTGCNAQRATQHIQVWEGPQLNKGRMSAALGGVMLRDGRVVIVGGSNIESPFDPVSGKEAIEVANRSCILSQKCIDQQSKCKCWQYSGINLPYKIGGVLYQLPDGRLIGFSSVFVFNRESNNLDPATQDGNPTAGPISAVIIDLDTKQVTPIYRAKNNKAGGPSLKSGDTVSLMQRAFERSLQLKDGRIVRLGGHVIYQKDPPRRKCQTNICFYCAGEDCIPSKPKIACETGKAEQDCPFQRGTSAFTVLDDVEIYTPPSRSNPKGSVKVLKMPTARSSVGAIEMPNGKVLIVGGWGPKGEGSNENYNTTYILDPNKEGSDAVVEGPKTLFYREDHAMSVLKDGRILVAGGTDLNGITINTCEYYDPTQGIFVHAPDMTIAREDHVPMNLGPWLLFIGGESKGKTDLIRNSVEIFTNDSGRYIGPKFLFSAVGTNESRTGVTDFVAIPLNTSTLLIAGGQQGLQDRDGEYISSGRGSNRTMLFRYRP